MTKSRARLQSASTVLWIAFVLSLLGLVLPTPLLARQSPGELSPDPGRRYFEETQFWVSGEFLAYFDARGGLEVFGYPISAPFNDSGILTQYFQNARMEWHPDNPEPYRVQLGLLGDELGFRQEPIERPALSAGRTYFAETGHTVTYMFLRYFRSHGGVDLFGYPISEMFVENQRVVQYFQRMKLIWTPQTGRVSVGNLGELYVAAHRSSLPMNALESLPYRYNDRGVVDLRTAIGLSRSVARSQKSQIVTVVVLDERSDEPLADAQVKLSLALENGTPLSNLTRILGTDARGRVRVTIPLDGIEPGTWVVLDVEATYGAVSTAQKQLFLVWW
jgi:5-hydroxyisourate hydrolase-like protein (transthyretin family)